MNIFELRKYKFIDCDQYILTLESTTDPHLYVETNITMWRYGSHGVDVWYTYKDPEDGFDCGANFIFSMESIYMSLMNGDDGIDVSERHDSLLCGSRMDMIKFLDKSIRKYYNIFDNDKPQFVFVIEEYIESKKGNVFLELEVFI